MLQNQKSVSYSPDVKPEESGDTGQTTLVKNENPQPAEPSLKTTKTRNKKLLKRPTLKRRNTNNASKYKY